MCLPRSAPCRSLVAAFYLALSAACAPPPGSAVTLPMTDHSLRLDRTLRERSTLTRAELVLAPDAFTTTEAIRRLRPEFLMGSTRNGSAVYPPALYLNDLYEGELWYLNSIPRDAIREVVFLHPAEASLRFGVLCRCPGGVLSVRTRGLER